MSSVSGAILGIVQGLTEFLPISSSGHLVLFRSFLGFKEPELLLDISLHLGTLLAVCIFFRSDLKEMIGETYRFIIDLFRRHKKISSINDSPHVMLTLWVIVGTIPTVLIGLIFKAPLESLFGDVKRVGLMLVCTGIILAITKLMPKDYNSRNRVGLLTALAVGVAQGLAITPGISRSGTTIVCGMLCRMERELSARFSFLLSIPAIIGALTLQLGSGGFKKADTFPVIFGFIASAIVGLIALKVLMKLVRRGKFFYFAPYCWALGLFIIIF